MENHYFIGIKVPMSVAQSLVLQRDSWKLSAHKRYPVAEDLHITLLFIGGDPHDQILDAAEALETIDHPSFELIITGTGYFGKSDRPRVVYGAIEESDPLKELQKKIKGALGMFNLSSDNKPFVPHITLANKWSSKDSWESIPKLKPESFRAEEFTLFRIEPNRSPRYIAVKSYKMNGSI